MKLTIKLTKIYLKKIKTNQKKYTIVNFCISTNQMQKKTWKIIKEVIGKTKLRT